MDSTKNYGKKILDKIILVAVLSLLSYLFTLLFSWIAEKSGTAPNVSGIVNCIIKSLFYLFIILGLSYNFIWSKKTFEKRGKKYFFYFASLVILLVCFSWLVFYSESRKLYIFLKNPVMLSERLFQTNPQLGYSPIPNNTGIHHYNNGKVRIDIPAVTDSAGRRTFMAPYTIKNDTTLLFLGCSFTWGDYSLAEETFTYMTAKGLNSRYINAGVSGYGLGQMLLLAKELIPQKKPTVVIAQYSPWLVQRANCGFTPTFFGTRFSPYFSKVNGKDTLVGPAYLSHLDEVPFEYYKRSSAGTRDKITFLKDVAWPVLFKPYIKKLLFELKIALGLLPKPNSDNTAIEQYFYKSLLTLCKENHAKLVILNVNAGYDNGYTKDTFCKIAGTEVCNEILFADAHQALCQNVKDNSAYIERFAHQKDSVIYDGHPNALAAKIISQTIIKTIKNK